MLRNLLAKLQARGDAALPTGCAHVQLRLLEYLDHELDSKERGVVETHLERCAGCRAEMAACRRVEAVLGSAVSAVPSPGDMRADFYARLEQSRRRSSRPGWALIAPAVACAAALFLLVRHPATDPGRPGFRRSAGHSVIARDITRVPNASSISGPAPGDAGTRERRQPRILRITSRAERRPLSQTRGHLYAVLKQTRRKSGVPGYAVNGARKNPVVLAWLGPEPTDPAAALIRGRVSEGGTWAAHIAAAVRLRDNSGSLEQNDGITAYQSAGRLGLASLVTELHVSDENRDFMSSTHIDSAASHRDTVETLRVDDDNDNAQEPVELPPLP